MGPARKAVIASRLAPTLDLWRTQIPCGSQPAGDGSGAVLLTEPYSISLSQAVSLNHLSWMRS
ncbi:hypothetical protein EQV97_16400 [Pseudomonas sp. TMW22090]|nr:hypothetical protein [Pseudomonas sp. TMW22090]